MFVRCTAPERLQNILRDLAPVQHPTFLETYCNGDEMLALNCGFAQIKACPISNCPGSTLGILLLTRTKL